MAKFGAIFDWDGVIVDSSAQHERSWELLASERNLPLPAGHFKRGFGKKNEAIIPDLGWATEADAVRRLGLRKEELYRGLVLREGVTVLPGARRLLEALRGAGVPCAVGSSTRRENIETIFDATGLRPFFSAVVSAEDVVHGKPAPDVFVAAAERIGLPPGRCVVFEDALVGIEAAHAGGMQCVAVATTNALVVLKPLAELAVASLEEITVNALVALTAEFRGGS
ncbi:MAG: HAD family phosphatase [Terrimicrobiaceae bacterium]|nr:HAD family phosphatase [Terrimicrobiaceae bacterium]